MPVYDWTCVDAGSFHAFHGAWIAHLMGRLNSGVLPAGYYALSEQHASGLILDVLALTRPDPHSGPATPSGGLALADAPPAVGRRPVADSKIVYRTRRRTMAIRHVSGDRIVAIFEIASPGNKDRASSVRERVDQIDDALKLGIHAMLIDLFPPGRFDPEGSHGALWERYGESTEAIDHGPPLSACSYRAVAPAEAYLVVLAHGEALPEMPLFVDAETYVNVPLEPTYRSAFEDLPAFVRDRLSAD